MNKNFKDVIDSVKAFTQWSDNDRVGFDDMCSFIDQHSPSDIKKALKKLKIPIVNGDVVLRNTGNYYD